MEAWFTSVCQTLTPGAGDALAIICAGLAVLVLAVITLGFAQQLPPLSTQLGRWSLRAPLDGSSSLDGGLKATWRLYRELRRFELRSR